MPKPLNTLFGISPDNLHGLEVAGIETMEDLANNTELEALSKSSKVEIGRLTELHELAKKEILAHEYQQKTSRQIFVIIAVCIISIPVILYYLSTQGHMEFLEVKKTDFVLSTPDELGDKDTLYDEAYYLYIDGNYDKAAKRLNDGFDKGMSSADLFNLSGLVYYEKHEYEKALKKFDEALVLQPNMNHALNNKALVYIDQGNYKSAINLYKEIIESNQSYYNAYQNLALVYYLQGNYEEALTEIKKLVDFAPDDALDNFDFYFLRAGILLNLGRYQDALSDYEKIMASYQNDMSKQNQKDVLDDYAYALYNIQQNNKALQTLDKAIAIDKADAWERNMRGNILFSLEKYNEAILEYRQAIKLEPQHYYAQSNIGLAQRRLKKYDEALKSFKLALRINPDYTKVYYEIGYTYFEKGEYKEALDSYEETIKRNPKYHQAFVGKGDALYATGSYEASIKAYDESLRLEPGYTAFKNKYAWSAVEVGNDYFGNKEYNNAIEFYEKALKLDNKYIYALANLGNIYLHKNELDLASYYIDEVLKQDSEYAYAYLLKGYYLLDIDKSEEAIEAYKKAIEIDPELMEAYSALSSAHFILNEENQARSVINDGLKRDPEHSDFYRMLGEIDLKNKLYDAAINNFDEAIKLNKDDPWAYMSKAKALARKGEKQSAIDLITQEMNKNPDNIADTIYDTRGFLYQEIFFEYQNAWHDYRKLYDKYDGKVSNYNRNYAEACLTTGRYAEAYKLFKEEFEKIETETGKNITAYKLVMLMFIFSSQLLSGEKEKAVDDFKAFLDHYSSEFVSNWKLDGFRNYINTSAKQLSGQNKDIIIKLIDILENDYSKQNLSILEQMHEDLKQQVSSLLKTDPAIKLGYHLNQTSIVRFTLSAGI